MISSSLASRASRASTQKPAPSQRASDPLLQSLGVLVLAREFGEKFCAYAPPQFAGVSKRVSKYAVVVSDVELRCARGGSAAPPPPSSARTRGEEEGGVVLMLWDCSGEPPRSERDTPPPALDVSPIMGQRNKMSSLIASLHARRSLRVTSPRACCSHTSSGGGVHCLGTGGGEAARLKAGGGRKGVGGGVKR
jgi:hypothetical protein